MLHTMKTYSYEDSSFATKYKPIMEGLFKTSLTYILWICCFWFPLVFIILWISHSSENIILRFINDWGFITIISATMIPIGWVYMILAHGMLISENLAKQKSFFLQTLKYNENIDEILLKLNWIRNTIQLVNAFLWFLRILRFFRLGLDNEKIDSLSQAVLEDIWFFINFIQNLRSDLQLRLTEQQQTIEQAKSEVSEHIHGTDELNQVSELQRQRLDRQIEQFEELQRVLVKI